MRTVFDYLHDYGNTSFNDKPMCEGDFVAFAHISSPLMQLVHFEDKELDQDSIDELIANYNDDDHYWFWQDDYINFLKLFFSCSRYKDFRLHDFRFLQTFEDPCQYDIATFINGDTAIVSFGGAGIHVKTYEEAARMTYTYTNAQKHAVGYINEINKLVKKIYILGFSKGGAAALYGALNCEEQDKIVKIYSFETPLFSIEQTKTPQYANIKNKIKYYVPQAAFIGMLLGYGRPKTICKSKNKSVYAHDSSSWEFEDDKLKAYDKVDDLSILIYFVFHNIMFEFNKQEMEIFVEGCIRIFDKLDLKTAHKIIKRSILKIPKIIFYIITEDKKFKRKFRFFCKSAFRSVKNAKKLLKEIKNYKKNYLTSK